MQGAAHDLHIPLVTAESFPEALQLTRHLLHALQLLRLSILTRADGHLSKQCDVLFLNAGRTGPGPLVCDGVVRSGGVDMPFAVVAAVGVQRNFHLDGGGMIPIENQDDFLTVFGGDVEGAVGDTVQHTFKRFLRHCF